MHRYVFESIMCKKIIDNRMIEFEEEKRSLLMILSKIEKELTLRMTIIMKLFKFLN